MGAGSSSAASTRACTSSAGTGSCSARRGAGWVASPFAASSFRPLALVSAAPASPLPSRRLGGSWVTGQAVGIFYRIKEGELGLSWRGQVFVAPSTTLLLECLVNDTQESHTPTWVRSLRGLF